MNVVDEILNMVGCERDGKLHVYWCLPEKEICDGLLPLETDEDCASMLNVINTKKCVVMFVDHTSFLKTLRIDAILQNKRVATVPSVINPEAPMPEPTENGEFEASTSGVVVSYKRHVVEGCHEFEDHERVIMQSEEEDDDSDSEYELYDSDYMNTHQSDSLISRHTNPLTSKKLTA
jgi:hypothetical protein